MTQLSHGSDGNDTVQGGLPRLKPPAVHEFINAPQSSAPIEHLGAVTGVAQVVSYCVTWLVISVVKVDSGIPLGGITSVYVSYAVPLRVAVYRVVHSPSVAFARGWPSQSLWVSKMTEDREAVKVISGVAVVVRSQSRDDVE